MTEDLHRALKTEIVARQSVGNAHFMLVKLQHGKDNFTYSLHAESSTLFTSGPKETDFFVWLGFEYGPCNFVSGQRCFVKAISSSFDLGSFCATFASAFADIAAAQNHLGACGYDLPSAERQHRRRSRQGYYGDGHHALDNPNKMKNTSDDMFEYVFTFQTTPEGKGWTIHCRPKVSVSEELRHALAVIDVKEFSECPQFDFEPCFWSFINYTGGGYDRFSDGNADEAHRYFDAHAPQFSQGIQGLMNANAKMKEFGMGFLRA